MPKTTFHTKIMGFGNNTGIEVPEKAILDLGFGKRPPVKVSIGSYTYKSTVAVMSGMYLISLSKSHRQASKLEAGDQVTVTLELDSGERTVDIPLELQSALKNEKLNEVFSQLAYSKRKEFCRQVSDAKAEDTRHRRIAKIISQLK